MILALEQFRVVLEKMEGQGRLVEEDQPATLTPLADVELSRVEIKPVEESFEARFLTNQREIGQNLVLHVSEQSL